MRLRKALAAILILSLVIVPLSSQAVLADEAEMACNSTQAGTTSPISCLAGRCSGGI